MQCHSDTVLFLDSCPLKCSKYMLITSTDCRRLCFHLCPFVCLPVYLIIQIRTVLFCIYLLVYLPRPMYLLLPKSHVQIYTFVSTSVSRSYNGSLAVSCIHNMMTSSYGDIFRVTGPLCGEITGHDWIPRTKAGDAELWRFLWFAPK